jgi:tight adherence protein C
MSDLLLPLGLLAMFASIALMGMALDLTFAQRRKTIEILQSQVDRVSFNFREQELAQSFFERVISPVMAAMGSAARRVTPLGMRDRLERRLVLAGSPIGWDAERVAAFKMLGAVAGGILGILIARTGEFSPLNSIAFALFTAGIAFVTPDVLLKGRETRRQEAIQKSLPDSIDLLTISVEAGLSFDAALIQVVRNVPGEFSVEIGRMLREIQLGESRVDAFRNLSERTKVEELDSFVLAMIQADVFGVSVSKVLRAQAADLRAKRRQRAERNAMQVPVKILFPMIFCIMPALFVVLLGPAAIRIIRDFFGAI